MRSPMAARLGNKMGDFIINFCWNLDLNVEYGFFVIFHIMLFYKIYQNFDKNIITMMWMLFGGKCVRQWPRDLVTKWAILSSISAGIWI